MRKGQFVAMAAAREEAADSRMAEYARQRFPGEFAGVEEVVVRRLVDRARGIAGMYGISREQNVATILDLVIMYGEEFHQAGWAARVLRDGEMDGDSKVKALRRSVAASGVRL